MTDRKQDIVERLTDRAASYRLGGQSSEHTATMLDEAAAEIERLRKALSHALDNASDMKAALCRDLDPDYES